MNQKLETIQQWMMIEYNNRETQAKTHANTLKLEQKELLKYLKFEARLKIRSYSQILDFFLTNSIHTHTHPHFEAHNKCENFNRNINMNMNINCIFTYHVYSLGFVICVFLGIETPSYISYIRETIHTYSQGCEEFLSQKHIVFFYQNRKRMSLSSTSRDTDNNLQ